MSLQRFNIRAKRSLPGLYAFDNANGGNSPSDISPRSDVEDFTLEDFGARLERCTNSPGKVSISKRKRLFGSLRSLRSLASLHSSPSKAKQDILERVESPVQHKTSATAVLPMSRSLALLDFQESPSDKPMFNLSLRERSRSGSSLEVQHSSPVAVPSSARQTIPHQLGPSAVALPTGTVPETPGPMQQAYNLDLANQTSRRNASPTPLERYAPSTPVLTPLPGTNMSVGDVDPEFVPLPPSLKPSTVQLSQEKHGYFDIPVNEQPQMDDADKLNGLAYLKLAADEGNSISKDLREISTSRSPVTRVCARLVESSVRTAVGVQNAKQSDTARALHVQQQHAQAIRRKQQAEAFDNAVRALKCPQNLQVLPVRPKQSEGDLYSKNRNNSVISGDWQTCSGRCSSDTASEWTHECPKECKYTEKPADRPTTAPSEDSKMAKSGSESPANFAYIVWDSPEEHRFSTTQKNIWAEHTGLYDGSGYGIEESGPGTPGEPVEGTENIHMQRFPRLIEVPPVSLSNDGGRPGEESATRVAKTGDPFDESVREWSPLPDEEQQDDGSLDFIYRAYA